MNGLAKTISVLTVPIIILDILGGLVGGIWLAIYGEWGILIGGIIYLFVGAFLISIVLMPSLLLALPATYFAERKKYFGLLFFGFLSATYVAIVIYFSCKWTFEAYTVALPDGNAILPYLLWAYAIATAPWAYMASKESDNSIGTFISLFFAKLGLLIIVVFTGLFGVSLETTIAIFGFGMFIEVIVCTWITISIIKEDKGGAVEEVSSDIDRYLNVEEAEIIEPTTNASYVNKNNFNVGDDSSILLVGQSGTGKSELVRSFMDNMKTIYEPTEVNFVLFDLKQVEFVDEDVSYLYRDVVTTAPQGVRVLRELIELAELRIKKEQRFPAIVVYVEECDIAAQFQDKFDDLMISLISEADKANFCIIYSTSRVSEQTISYKLLKHFDTLLVSRLNRGATQYLGVDDTSEVSGYNFVKYDNRNIRRYTHPTSTDDYDTLIKKAVKLARAEGKASAALFQRELHIGYAMSARIIERLEEMGVVGPADGAKPREVLTKTSAVHHKKPSGDDELEDWDSLKDKE